jgi:hypothetical protein
LEWRRHFSVTTRQYRRDSPKGSPILQRLRGDHGVTGAPPSITLLLAYLDKKYATLYDL